MKINESCKKRLFLLFDTYHMNIEAPSIELEFVKFYPYIGHIHIADSNRFAPGMGHLNFSNLFQFIKHYNYDQYVSAEIIHHPNIYKSVEEA